MTKRHGSLQQLILMFCLLAYRAVLSDDRVTNFREQEEDILRVGTNIYLRVYGFELSESSKRNLIQFHNLRNIKRGLNNADGFFAILNLEGKDLYVEQLGDGCFLDYYYSVLSGTATTQTNYLGAKFGYDVAKLPIRASWFCGKILIGNPDVSFLSSFAVDEFSFTNGVLSHVDICVSLSITNPELLKESKLVFVRNKLEGGALDNFVNNKFVYDGVGSRTNEFCISFSNQAELEKWKKRAHKRHESYKGEVFFEY